MILRFHFAVFLDGIMPLDETTHFLNKALGVDETSDSPKQVSLFLSNAMIGL